MYTQTIRKNTDTAIQNSSRNYIVAIAKQYRKIKLRQYHTNFIRNYIASIASGKKIPQQSRVGKNGHNIYK